MRTPSAPGARLRWSSDAPRSTARLPATRAGGEVPELVRGEAAQRAEDLRDLGTVRRRDARGRHDALLVLVDVGLRRRVVAWDQRRSRVLAAPAAVLGRPHGRLRRPASDHVAQAFVADGRSSCHERTNSGAEAGSARPRRTRSRQATYVSSTIAISAGIGLARISPRASAFSGTIISTSPRRWSGAGPTRSRTMSLSRRRAIASRRPPSTTNSTSTALQSRGGREWNWPNLRRSKNAGSAGSNPAPRTPRRHHSSDGGTS